ncbi:MULTISPECIES: MSHA biogenesis protein MshP [Aeromonas]|uniref:MSHA biogenesis protein MshP n=1 Tax=Aeromonas TaxID=642 RepID=UPI00191E2ACD|nr:MSHA biogenesis protein MshP [Aeromonas enteropelogenes]MBL0522940.1 MSHA biogenesis protein MshP [Aeromonas enteropelogenes]
MCPDVRRPTRARGSALMIALFVIVVMALLAAALGRMLTDSSEKNTVEVRSVRALLAAQSGLEMALSQLFPKLPAAPAPANLCDLVNVPPTFGSDQGLASCQVRVECVQLPITYQGETVNGYRLLSTGTCGQDDLASANPDFAVSRTVTIEAYGGATP